MFGLEALSDVAIQNAMPFPRVIGGQVLRKNIVAFAARPEMMEANGKEFRRLWFYILGEASLPELKQK